MEICVVGTGYVGLVTGTCFSEVGHSVFCVDIDKKKIDALKDGVSPIFEPGIEELILRNLQHERLHFTTDLDEAIKGARATFIAVGTPEGEDGSADLQYVMAVARSIGEKMQGDMLVVVKSTVPVGTCDIVERTIQEQLDKRKATFKLIVASNPEFLKEGTAIEDCMKPERIIVGVSDNKAEDLFREIYQPFIIDDPSRLIITDRRSSELTKYGANAMLATRITFMNELARLCDAVGADIDHVRRGMGTDSRIGKKFLYSGPGYGGSCFPKDVEALIRTGTSHKIDLSVLKSVSSANAEQKRYATRKVTDYFNNDLAGKKIAVWGLAFKPGTDDVRETPAFEIIKTLLDKGASVSAHDPEGRDNFAKLIGAPKKLVYCEEAYDTLGDANALVLVTEWNEYKRPNWEKVGKMMAEKVVFDLRNQYRFDSMSNLGFHYECIGRPDSRTKAEKRM